jgi:hypothetical protein
LLSLAGWGILRTGAGSREIAGRGQGSVSQRCVSITRHRKRFRLQRMESYWAW